MLGPREDFGSKDEDKAEDEAEDGDGKGDIDGDSANSDGKPTCHGKLA